MKRGKMYSFVSDFPMADDYRPDHPLIKKLHEKGVTCIQLCYASHFATDAGWNVMDGMLPNGKPFNPWLGYTIAEALRNIDKMAELNR